MFTPATKLSSQSEHERILRRRAIEEATTLYRVHGAVALGLVRMTRFDGSKGPDERRYLRLMLIELERLDREGRRRNALVPWRPPAVGWRRLLHRLVAGQRRRG